MDVNSDDFLDLWRMLNKHSVRYILVGGFAANFHGYQRFTGDVDLYVEDTLENRKKLRKAYKEYCKIDFQGFETIQFVPGWVDFPLRDGTRLDIMTSMVGIDALFEECLQSAWMARMDDIEIPVLNILHLIDNKRAVGREKDQVDAMHLERILQRHKQNGGKKE